MPVTTWLSIAGVLMWAGYEVLLRRRSDRDAADWHGETTDRGSTRLLIAAYGVAVILTIVLSNLGVAQVSLPVRWVGVGMLAAGLALRAWGMAVLGRFYTRTLRVVSDQRVVTEGPYRLIRHPGYAGSILVWTGYCLGCGSWIALAAVAALMFVAYGWRIRSEEQMLVASLGSDYVAYQRRTARLVPFVY